MNKEDVHNV